MGLERSIKERLADRTRLIYVEDDNGGVPIQCGLEELQAMMCFVRPFLTREVAKTRKF